MLATMLGLALAAFFWLPAFWFKNLVQVSRLTQGRFGFSAGFQSLGTLFSYDVFFSLGWLWLLLFAAPAVVVLLRKRKAACVRLIAVPFLLALFLVVLVTAPSRVLWENIPLLPYFQFPWRFLGPMAVFLALACGISVYCLGQFDRKIPWRVLERLVFVLLLGNALLACTPARPVSAGFDALLQKKRRRTAIRRSWL